MLRNVLVTRIHYANEVIYMAAERRKYETFAALFSKQLFGQMCSKFEEILVYRK